MSDYELLKTIPFATLAIFASIKAGLLYASLILLFTLFHYLNSYYKVLCIIFIFINIISKCMCNCIYINKFK